jgi:hypothetical protein
MENPIYLRKGESIAVHATRGLTCAEWSQSLTLLAPSAKCCCLAIPTISAENFGHRYSTYHSAFGHNLYSPSHIIFPSFIPPGNHKTPPKSPRSPPVGHTNTHGPPPTCTNGLRRGPEDCLGVAAVTCMRVCEGRGTI